MSTENIIVYPSFRGQAAAHVRAAWDYFNFIAADPENATYYQNMSTKEIQFAWRKLNELRRLEKTAHAGLNGYTGPKGAA